MVHLGARGLNDTCCVWQGGGGAVYSSGDNFNIMQSTFSDCSTTNAEAVRQHMACMHPADTRVGESCICVQLVSLRA